MSSSTGANATLILSEITQGDQGAADRLFPLVYDELRAIAHYRLGGAGGAAMQPTAMVHEAYLRLIDQTMDRFNSETHFKAVAARAMRFVLVDHYRREGAEKRGGGATHVTLNEELVAAGRERDVDGTHLAGALARLAEMDERKSRVVELRFLGGLSIEETATVLGVARSTVARDWQMARAWLACEIEDAQGS